MVSSVFRAQQSRNQPSSRPRSLAEAPLAFPASQAALPAARAASGHAAEPPTSVMNSRRFMLISDGRRQVTPRLMETLRGGSTLGEFRDR
jgi:hypothetical protein